MKKLVLVMMALALLCACHPVETEKTVGVRADALSDSLWNCSEWISVVDAPVITDTVYDGSRAADGASWFVTTTINEQPVTRVLWMSAGLGVYDLFINGQRVGEEVLKPGFTHYARTKRSFTYDITDAFLLEQGATNTWAAQVTPGWWADKIISTAGEPGMFGRKVAFRSVLAIEYADGTTTYLGTNTTDWLAGIAGPVTHASIFDGEEYDARIPMGYETPELLSTPEVNREFCGEILPSEGAEVYLRYDLAMAPVRAYVYNKVTDIDSTHYGRVVIDREYRSAQTMTITEGETLIVDFGQNCAAVPEFIFEAEPGTVLTFAGGELLNDSLGSYSRRMDGPEGSVHRTNLRVPDTGVTLFYTFGTDHYFIPRATFFGYRYAAISATGNVCIHRLRSVPVSSMTASLETGSITTGERDVNRLILNTLWGQRSNYLSVPTDCPQRNERLGWTADTQVYARTGTFFANTRDFFRKWLRDLRDTQSATGSYPGVAPWGQYGSNSWDCSRAGWADAGVIVPYTMYLQYADTVAIDAHWASMERFMDRIASQHYDHTALFEDNGGYQWADWLGYEPLESCSGQPWDDRGLRPEAAEYWSYLCGSYWVMDTEMVLHIARGTGRDTAKWEQMLAEARAYMQQRFLRADGTFRLDILNTMQTPALFALRNRLVEGEAREAMIARLRQNFTEHDMCLQTGFLGTSILMKTLTDNDMVDIAYNLLLQHRDPSWLYSVDQGATSIWERWNSYTIETGMHPHGMNSFNHYSYGCVCQWLWETAAGIAADPAQPGFRHIIMRPVPDKRLGHLEATYQSAAGLITSEWHYEGETCVWTFSIPEGATATVTLPGATDSHDYAAGTYTLTL